MLCWIPWGWPGYNPVKSIWQIWMTRSPSSLIAPGLPNSPHPVSTSSTLHSHPVIWKFRTLNSLVFPEHSMPIYTFMHSHSLFSLPPNMFLHSHLVNFVLCNPAQRQLLWRPFSLLSIPYRQNLLFFLRFCLTPNSLCCDYTLSSLRARNDAMERRDVLWISNISPKYLTEVQVLQTPLFSKPQVLMSTIEVATSSFSHFIRCILESGDLNSTSFLF